MSYRAFSSTKLVRIFALALVPTFGGALVTGCWQPSNAFYIDNTSADHNVSEMIVTAVGIACDGACAAHAPVCAQVTWTYSTADAPTKRLVDVAKSCSNVIPAGDDDALELLVTSNVPIDPTVINLVGDAKLLNEAGTELPNSTSFEGAGEETDQSVDPPAS